MAPGTWGATLPKCSHSSQAGATQDRSRKSVTFRSPQANPRSGEPAPPPPCGATDERRDVMYDLKNMPFGELERLAEATQEELVRRRELDAIPERVAQLNDTYSREQENADAVPFDPVPHFGHGPGTTVLWDDDEWKNISGAWLTVSPADYPLGWAQQTGLPDDVPQWEPGIDVTAGDLYEYQGTVYRVIQDHATQEGWTPDAVPALYTPQG